MPRKSSKQAGVQSITMNLNGGLNYAQSPANIADNELKRAMNFIYDPETDQLMTRPGSSCQTASALSDPILQGYYYVKDSTTAYHICASGGKLYYLSGAGLDEWTEIGSLADSSTRPSFLTFNGHLLIADGGTGIKYWDGSTYNTIADSPNASALSVIGNRVVANAVDEPDSVYLSAPNDAESADAWDTTKSAVGLKAGYGDLLAVNAFGVFKSDLIISKVGSNSKRLYRLNVEDATTTNWFVESLSENNASQTAHTMLSAWNNVFFIDTNGFKSLKGVQEYGDLQVDAVGRKINTIFAQSYNADGMAYIPSYNAIWFNIGDRVFCYTERHDPTSGKNNPAFTNLLFNWGRCTSIYEADDVVYLTGYNGYLYKLDEELDTDETEPDVTSSYISTVRGKTLSFFADGVLRKLEFYLKPKSVGDGILYVCRSENDKVLLKSFSTVAEGQYVYDATDYLNDATGFLYDLGTSSWNESTRNRFRGTEMAFEIELSSGRCGVEWCKAEIALLEGGE